VFNFLYIKAFPCVVAKKLILQFIHTSTCNIPPVAYKTVFYFSAGSKVFLLVHSIGRRNARECTLTHCVRIIKINKAPLEASHSKHSIRKHLLYITSSHYSENNQMFFVKSSCTWALSHFAQTVRFNYPLARCNSR